jgi:hypothetical protein
VTDRDKFAKNLERMRAELREVLREWDSEDADQPGWSHEYMQHCRTLARKAPITCATLIGIVGPLLIAALLILGWIAW